MTAQRLPNLLIVGVPKAGTTSLFAYLAQHPQICGSREKEPGYFDQFSPLRPADKPRMTIEAYLAHFAQCDDQPYLMEGTPSYCYGGQSVIDAIRSTLARPRILMVLRDPTDRLWSAYTFQRSSGRLPGMRSFREYLAVCEQRRRDGSDRVSTGHLQGLSTGFYAEYVPSWLNAFGADMRVVFADEMAANPRSVLETIFLWLGVDRAVAAEVELERHNVTLHAKSPGFARAAYALKRAGDRTRLMPRPVRDRLRRLYVRLNAGAGGEVFAPELRRHVDAIYREPNEELATVLGSFGYESLPKWLRQDDP